MRNAYHHWNTRDLSQFKETENKFMFLENITNDKILCENNHELYLQVCTSHSAFKATCNKCDEDITKEQSKTGYYNCSIDKTNFHKDCVELKKIIINENN